MFANLASLAHFSKYTAGGASGATATQTGVSGQTHFVTHINGWLDEDAIVTIKDGSTVVWESKVDISLEGTTFSFEVGVIPISGGADAVGNIDTSVADCAVSIAGFTI